MTNSPATITAPARGPLVIIALAAPALLLDDELPWPLALAVLLLWPLFPPPPLPSEDDALALAVVDDVDPPLDDKLVAAACARLLYLESDKKMLVEQACVVVDEMPRPSSVLLPQKAKQLAKVGWATWKSAATQQNGLSPSEKIDPGQQYEPV